MLSFLNFNDFFKGYVFQRIDFTFPPCTSLTLIWLLSLPLLAVLGNEYFQRQFVIYTLENSLRFSVSNTTE